MSEIETLQKRIQDLEALEQDYKQLKALIDHAVNGGDLEKYLGEMLLYVDPLTDRILDASAATLDFLGYSIIELQAMTIASLEQKTKIALSLFENNQPFELYEANYRHKDGFQLRVKVRTRQIILVDKKILRYALEDKSLHRQLWRELSRREDSNFQFREKLKILNELNLELGRLSSLDDLCRGSIERGMLRLGLDRLSIWLIDRSKGRMLGTFGVDEVGQIRDERGLSWIYSGGDIQEFLAGRHEPIIVNSDAPIYNDRSEYVGYGWHISVPLFDGDEFVGFMGVDNFINKRPLESYQADVLQLFGASLGHLMARLLKQQKALELQLEQERLRVLGDFVTDVGHEFKTPLSIIKTSAYFLGKTITEDKRHAHAEKIADSVTYLDYLLNAMLEMVKLDSQAELKSGEFQFDSLLSEVLESFLPNAAAKQIHCQISSQSSSHIKADYNILRRAIEEIIKNAIEYTPPQGNIQISLTESPSHLHLVVQDLGLGIPADEIGKIFQRFYRVDKARSSRHAGLGLAISKRSIELHGGEIRAESTLGAGTRFEIILPI